MTIYNFTARLGPGDPADHVEVATQFNDETDARLDNVVGAFVMFLKGCTFEPESIKKFIDHEMVYEVHMSTLKCFSAFAILGRD